jgi:topoisomerase-4 subunit A
VIVIKEGYPWETDVHEILAYNTERLVYFLKCELEIERDLLLEKVFYKTLERIFIEEKIYKKIEKVKTLEGIHECLHESFKPYRKKLVREPTADDRDRLLLIPIRRISQFDIDKNKEEITLYLQSHKDIEKSLKNVKKFAIEHLRALIEKYGAQYPRKTKFKSIEEIDRRAIETKELKVGLDFETGFVGTKVTGGQAINCTNFDKILTFDKNGSYKVINIPEKLYVEKLVLAMVADKKTIVTVVYKQGGFIWAKKFVVDKFILDKTYECVDPEADLLYMTTQADVPVELTFVGPKARTAIVSTKDTPIKSAQVRGTKLSPEKVKKATFPPRKK